MIHAKKKSAYVFDADSARRFIEQRGLTLSEPTRIADYYLEPKLRVRRETSSRQKTTYRLQRQWDKKTDDARAEQEAELSGEAAVMLIPGHRLLIVKQRYKFDLPGFPSAQATFDFTESPMRLAILKLKTNGEKRAPTTRELLGVDLIECPLSAWQLFRRRIGICGGPSAEKSEMARFVTHALNTQFRADAFHVQEFATTFIQKYDRPPGFDDQSLLWHGQKSREQDANGRTTITLSDCPTFLTYIYALAGAKGTLGDHANLHLTKLYKRAVQDLQGYTDMIFLAAQDYKDNNIRFQTPQEAQATSDRVEGFLADHGVPFRRASYRGGPRLLRDLFFLNAIEA